MTRGNWWGKMFEAIGTIIVLIIWVFSVVIANVIYWFLYRRPEEFRVGDRCWLKSEPEDIPGTLLAVDDNGWCSVAHDAPDGRVTLKCMAHELRKAEGRA